MFSVENQANEALSSLNSIARARKNEISKSGVLETPMLGLILPLALNEEGVTVCSLYCSGTEEISFKADFFFFLQGFLVRSRVTSQLDPY